MRDFRYRNLVAVGEIVGRADYRDGEGGIIARGITLKRWARRTGVQWQQED